ncbi:MAG: AAA family ATPase, partial [Gammaproteobacteria bacterium]
MKISELLISNILSYPYCENIVEATKINFDDELNIFIGENGSGKSTILEIINFIFKKVLFKQYDTNWELFDKSDSVQVNERKGILSLASSHHSYSEFRLEKNWNTQNEESKIRLTISLDELDKKNITNLIQHMARLKEFAVNYTGFFPELDINYSTQIIIDINLHEVGNFSVTSSSEDSGYRYLVNYNVFKKIIELYNVKNEEKIEPLYETFTLISGYRNYHQFVKTTSLQNDVRVQIENINKREYAHGVNMAEEREPKIFEFIKLKIAQKHYDVIMDKKNNEQSEAHANNLPLLKSINKKLKIINLECKIRLVSQRTWTYAFEFCDLKRGTIIKDINSLSAGQKAITHLIFEAYGRGELKGGVVIIDEPEIHLHYQFQHEYFRIIKEINGEQKCQYVLVTHSESLINSDTIHNVKRFALNDVRNTVLKSPKLNADKVLLVKILDNTRSTHALFSRKVLLVEGETDRYFFKALIKNLDPEFEQEIAVLDISGKKNHRTWKDFFEDYGLAVYFFGDLDAANKILYQERSENTLDTQEKVIKFKKEHPDIETKIEENYTHGIYILKDGDLESYLGIKKGLEQVI